MASHIHIAYWGGNDHTVSPVLSSTPSIVSVDSVLSLAHERETPSIVQEATGPTSPRDSLAKRMSSLLTRPSGNETLTSADTSQRADAAGDDSFIRHHTYFFKDGNVTFLVDGTLYCLHRYLFSRDSVYFSTRFDQFGTRDHEALPITISLGDIERKDFDAFLSILYPENYEKHDLSYEEWKSVLHLSTRWNFASIRRLALNNIQPPTPHDRLLLARTYSVDDWLVPALSKLCERGAPLSLNEARQMDIEDVILVATVREDIRNHALQVDAAETPRCVEAAQAGNLVPPAIPTSGAVEHASSLMGQNRASNGSESDGEAMEKQEAPEEIDVRTERLAQLMQDSQAEITARYEARVEAVRHMVKEPECKAEAEETERKAEAEETKRKAEAVETKRKTEAAEREAEVARVAKLEAEVARLQAEVKRVGDMAQTAVSGVPATGKAKKKKGMPVTVSSSTASVQ